jgi:hypothetical protein
MIIFGFKIGEYCIGIGITSVRFLKLWINTRNEASFDTLFSEILHNRGHYLQYP